jgi:hypothetical protein
MKHKHSKRKCIFTNEVKAEVFHNNTWQRYDCFVEYEAYPDDDALYVADFVATDEQKNVVEDRDLLIFLRAHLEQDARLNHFTLMERAI